MKKLCLLILVACAFGCRQPSAVEQAELYLIAGKIRSFAFVNLDSIKYYNASLQKLADRNKPADKAVLNYCEGMLNLTYGYHDKAENNFQEAAAAFEKLHNDTLLFFSQVAIGNCNKLRGDADDAIFHYLKALHGSETGVNQQYLGICYANLAETYQQKNDLLNAGKYLALAEENVQYPSRRYLSLMHLKANLFGMTNKIDSALLTDYEGIRLAKAHNFPDELTPFYDNIAQCYMSIRNYDSAIHYFKNCIFIDSLNGRLQLMADTYAQMVNVYAFKNDTLAMKASADRAFRLSDSTQYLRGKYRIYEGLNNYYTEAGDWRNVAIVKDSIQQIYKRLINEETEAKIAEYNVAYETDKKERLIITQQDNLQKAKYLAVFVSIIALLLGLSIFVLFRNYRIRKSVAVNDAIQKQKDNNVMAIFETEQAERIRIARDLHDSIGQKLSVLKMYLNNRENDAVKTPELLDDTIQEVRNISHNLLPEELNFGLINAIKADIDRLQHTGAFVIDSHIHEADYSVLSLLISLNIVRIFRELQSNIAKHSFASVIMVELSLQDQQFTLQLKDDGIGIDPVAIEKSSGIGWKNIFTRIEMLHGTISIAALNPGTNIIIKIPVG